MNPEPAKLNLKTSLLALADIVLPRVCVVCGRALIPQEQHICFGCLADLPRTHYSIRSHNPMADRFNEKIGFDVYEPYAYASALFFYSAEADYRLIPQALKYRRDFGSGKYFSRLLGETLAASPLFTDVGLVVPVPLHWTRRWERGYNQAEVVARVIASCLGAECGPRVLKRNRRTKSQAHVSVREKAGNVSGAFTARARKVRALKSYPVHILLVDDVFTTGATLAACHAALRTCFGPGVRISIATLAFVA